MCFIIKGTVRVVTSEGQTLATLSKYKHFGEMALISEHVTLRSTSIVADSNVELAVLSKDDFKIICSHYPFFKTRMQEIIDMRTKDSQKKGF
jgi:signal-transduction protein with cAMP-binding, CBS, and nucleotidyltransferase domain